MIPLHVYVTQLDIQVGISHNPWHCPVALAMTRALNESFPAKRPQRYQAAVGYGAYKIERTGQVAGDKEFRGSGRLPTSAEQFAFAYDRGEMVKPFNFYVDIHDPQTDVAARSYW